LLVFIFVSRKEIFKPLCIQSVFLNGLKKRTRPLPVAHNHSPLYWSMKIISPTTLGAKVIHSKLTPYILIKKLSSKDNLD